MSIGYGTGEVARTSTDIHVKVDRVMDAHSAWVLAMCLVNAARDALAEAGEDEVGRYST